MKIITKIRQFERIKVSALISKYATRGTLYNNVIAYGSKNNNSKGLIGNRNCKCKTYETINNGEIVFMALGVSRNKSLPPTISIAIQLPRSPDLHKAMSGPRRASEAQETLTGRAARDIEQHVLFQVRPEESADNCERSCRTIERVLFSGVSA